MNTQVNSVRDVFVIYVSDSVFKLCTAASVAQWVERSLRV